MELYVLTEGIYSDYRVIGIFDNMDDYNEACKFVSPNPITIMTLNKMPDGIPEGMYSFAVTMKENVECNVNHCNINYLKYYGTGWMPQKGDDSITFYMWAKDEEHAIKIASERKAILVANNQWIVDINEYYEKKKTLIKFSEREQ